MLRACLQIEGDVGDFDFKWVTQREKEEKGKTGEEKRVSVVLFDSVSTGEDKIHLINCLGRTARNKSVSGIGCSRKERKKTEMYLSIKKRGFLSSFCVCLHVCVARHLCAGGGREGLFLSRRRYLKGKKRFLPSVFPPLLLFREGSFDLLGPCGRRLTEKVTKVLFV